MERRLTVKQGVSGEAAVDKGVGDGYRERVLGWEGEQSTDEACILSRSEG